VLALLIAAVREALDTKIRSEADVEDVLEILAIPLLAVVPESGEVLRSSNVGAPVTVASPSSAPAQAYLEAARRLNGEAGGVVAASEKPGLFGKLFTRRAA